MAQQKQTPDGTSNGPELIDLMEAMSTYRPARVYKRIVLALASEYPQAVLNALADADKALEQERTEKAEATKADRDEADKA